MIKEQDWGIGNLIYFIKHNIKELVDFFVVVLFCFYIMQMLLLNVGSSPPPF